jgi:hypothetical protein
VCVALIQVLQLSQQRWFGMEGVGVQLEGAAAPMTVCVLACSCSEGDVRRVSHAALAHDEGQNIFLCFAFVVYSSQALTLILASTLLNSLHNSLDYDEVYDGRG